MGILSIFSKKKIDDKDKAKLDQALKTVLNDGQTETPISPDTSKADEKAPVNISEGSQSVSVGNVSSPSTPNTDDTGSEATLPVADVPQSEMGIEDTSDKEQKKGLGGETFDEVADDTTDKSQTETNTEVTQIASDLEKNDTQESSNIEATPEANTKMKEVKPKRQSIFSKLFKKKETKSDVVVDNPEIKVTDDQKLAIENNENPVKTEEKSEIALTDNTETIGVVADEVMNVIPEKIPETEAPVQNVELTEKKDSIDIKPEIEAIVKDPVVVSALTEESEISNSNTENSVNIADQPEDEVNLELKKDEVQDEIKVDETKVNENNKNKSLKKKNGLGLFSKKKSQVSVDKKDNPLILNINEGINLLPPATSDEIARNERKASFNIAGAVFILVLVLLSIGIIGSNFIAKLENQGQKKILTRIEKEVLQDQDTLTKNSYILRRIKLFDSIQQNTVSYREVFEYWDQVSSKLGKISNIELDPDLHFIVRGEASSLTDVAKLWHLLSMDSRVNIVNLNSVGSYANKTTFEFEGQLNYDYFKNKTSGETSN
ncbi:MAG TPA: hypothetical protein PLX79_02350 [Candidatus Dojkabacteria bacterium]|nr:hypothetical protein [Candidatus Dojkabacteria bacterium]